MPVRLVSRAALGSSALHRSSTRAYDLSYSAKPTPFILGRHQAEQLHARARHADRTGSISVRIWFGELPSTIPIRQSEGLAFDNG